MSNIDTTKNYVSQILHAVQDLIKHSPFDKTFRSKVIGQESDGKYKVFYKNKEYFAKSDVNQNIGDLVWVCAPRNNWNELYIQSGSYIQNQVNQVNSNLTKINLTFFTGTDTELVVNSTYKEDNRLYIDLSLRILTNFTSDTIYYFGKLAQSPQKVKTVFGRTNSNFLFTGWIDGDGHIKLHNRTGEDFSVGEIIYIMCVLPL